MTGDSGCRCSGSLHQAYAPTDALGRKRIVAYDGLEHQPALTPLRIILCKLEPHHLREDCHGPEAITRTFCPPYTMDD
jgi:hypothetical protein